MHPLHVHVDADSVGPLDDLPAAIGQFAPEKSASQAASGLSATDLDELERATILRVFEQVNGDKTLAGKMLGISRATLYRKLKRYGIADQAMSAAGS